MVNKSEATNKSEQQTESGATLAERASELKERAGGLLQNGVEAVKANPGAAAAIVGGVAAAAAAYVNRDKLAETASGLRAKASGSGKQDGSETV